MNSRLNRVIGAIPRLLKLDRAIEDVKFNQGLILSRLHEDARYENLWEYEFKVFSQWGEDGIIQHLTKHIGIPNKTFIEFGVEDFYEANCRYLLMKNHWKGFVIDGSAENIRRLRASYFFWQQPLACRATFITRENVRELLAESGFAREIGLLSIDLDGVDYHVLDALEEWKPAILIVEYNDVFGFSRAVTVPYDPAFVRARKHWSNQYWGASLPAYCHLAGTRGYALVGTNSVGSNAFFVRRELLNERVTEASVDSCARPATFRDSRDESGTLTYLSGRQRAEAIVNLPLHDVIANRSLRVGELFD